MRAHRWLLLVFLCAFVLALGVSAPAALVNTYLNRMTGGQLTLARTEGTLWQGSGVLLLRHGTQFLPLGRYAWQVRPATELGRISLVVDGGGDAPSHLLISPWRNEVEVLRGNALLPAQLLAVFAPQLTPYRLSGELLLSSEHFLVTPDSSAGTVTLDWRQATSGLTDIAPLGDYRVLLLGEEKDLKITLSTLGGKLLLSGNGLIKSGGKLSLQGTAQATPDQRENLSDLLHHIGPELSPGVFGFSLSAQ